MAETTSVGPDRAVSRVTYSRVAIAIHWATAAAILFELGLGLAMAGSKSAGAFASYQLHKSIGLTILLLTVLRIAWRVATPPPEPSASLSDVERGVAKIAHGAFYGLLLMLPLTGWVMVSSSRVAVATKLYGLIAWPRFPGAEGLAPQARAAVNDLAKNSHEVLAYGALLLLLLHVAGAVKHHLIDRDTTLERILPFRADRLTGALGAVVLLGAISFGGGYGLPGRLQPPSAGPPRFDADAGIQRAVSPPASNDEAQPPTGKDRLPASDPAAPVGSALLASVADTAPTTWTVDHARSNLAFGVTWDGQPLTGRFSAWSAKIVFDPAHLDTASADVTISVASATTGRAEVDEALPGSDWLAADASPKARFVATRFRKLPVGRYEALGELSIRGVRKPVRLPFDLSIEGDRAVMSGAVTFDRRTFGVGQGDWAATESVAANVTVTVKIVATRN